MSRESDRNTGVPATLLQNYANALYPPGTGNAYGRNVWEDSIAQYDPQTVYPEQPSGIPAPQGIYDLQRPPHNPVYLPSTGETVVPPDYNYNAPLFQNQDYNSIMLERSFYDLLDYLKRQLGPYYHGMMDIPLNPQERQRYY
jgi:hypothetical protein